MQDVQKVAEEQVLQLFKHVWQ